MVRRAESLFLNEKGLLLKKGGWSSKKFLQERNAPVDFKNPLSHDPHFISYHLNFIFAPDHCLSLRPIRKSH